MSDSKCEVVREMIPDHGAGRLGADESALVEAHMAGCDECRLELELVGLVLASTAAVPDGLAGRVDAAWKGRGTPRHRRWWGLSAAAVAALALGINMTSTGTDPVELLVPGYAYEVEEGDLWLSDDGVIAGAATLDGLSDEALAQLLEELTVGASGGAA